MNADADIPSLNALRSFTVAARFLSFTKAAAELNVTPGAINRLVKTLEHELGIRLLERSGRSIKLTPAGASLYPILVDAFELITTATRSLRSRNDNNFLSINVPSTFAMRWLLPRLPKFQEAYPDILVDIRTRDGLLDFSRDRVDVAVLYCDGNIPDATATYLIPEKMGVFCSPSLIKKKKLRQLVDLHNFRMLRNSTRPNAWPDYFSSNSIPDIRESHTAPTFEHFFMVIEAAVGGMGVAILPEYLVHDEIQDGRLVQPLKQTLDPSKSYYVVHADVANSKKIRIFERWLLDEARVYMASH